MKAIADLTEFEIRAILGIVYPGWDDDKYEIMKEKNDEHTRTIIFRNKGNSPNRRKYDVVLHRNYDIDIFETYLATGSRGKIEMRNVVPYAQYLMSLGE